MIVTVMLRFLAKKIEDVARLKIKVDEIKQNRQFSCDEKDQIYCDSVTEQVNDLLNCVPDIDRQALYMALQIEESESDENKWYAGISKNDTSEHYANNRAEIFEQKFHFIKNQPN
jgi:hypothetical protein